MNFVDFVKQKAAQCGWRYVDVHNDSFVSLAFDSDHGTEHCFVRPVGKNNEGNTVLEFSSVGVNVPRNESDAGVMSRFLLKRNSNMLMGAWAIEESNQGDKFVILVKMIANTMDAEEFEGAVNAVLGERNWLQKFFQKNAINF